MIPSRSNDGPPAERRSGLRPVHAVVVTVGVIAAVALALWVFNLVIGVVLSVMRVVVVAAAVLGVGWLAARFWRKG